MKRSAESIYNVYGFEKTQENGEMVNRPNTHLNMGLLPMYEREDLFPAPATAFNKAMQYDYEPVVLQNEDVYKVDEATVRYVMASSAYNGGRIIRETDLPNFRMKQPGHMQMHRLNENHLLNVRAEPKKGYRTVNPMVRESVSRQKIVTTGNGNKMRARGGERDYNPKIYPQLPDGLPMSVEPQRATLDATRINQSMVDTIAAFPEIGF
jgi:hypothetical protein